VTIQENVSLKAYSTMRLGGSARYLAEAANQQELVDLVNWATEHSVSFMIIGGGSNIVWRDEGYSGLLIVGKIPGLEVVQEDDQTAIIKIGAGENWDHAVAWTVDKGLSGLEFLSLIPGTAGAAPVQNIGAYGGEIATSLVEVAVYDTQIKAFGSIPAADCGFAYRTSRFKSQDRGRFVITSLVLKLKKQNPSPPFYDVLQKYFDEHDVHEFTPAAIRAAVVAIRSTKMPDPSVVANNGSFFTNPIIDQAQYDQLKDQFPDIKSWQSGQGRVKLAAGWLVEQAGFRGVHDEQTGMATSDKQALVLINEHAKSTADLLAFKQKIVDAVQAKFGITLEQEPELLP